MNDKNTTMHTHEDVKEPGLLHHLYASVAATIGLMVILCGVYPLIVWGLSQAIFSDKANGSLVRDAGGNVIGSSLLGQPFSADKYFHPRPSSAGSGYDASNSSGSNLGPTSAKLLNGTTKPSPPPTPDATAAAMPTTAPASATQAAAAPATQPTTQPSVVVDFDGIRDRVVHYIVENNLPYTSSQPLDGFKDAQGNLDDVKLINAFNADSPLVVTPKDPIPADAVTGSASGLDPHISVANAKIQAARVAKARGADVNKVIDAIGTSTDGSDLGIFGEPGVNVLKLNLALDKEMPAK